MIEFVLKNRKLRLHPDGVMYVRSINKFGEETKKETWREMKFYNSAGYMRCRLLVDGTSIQLLEHRIVWYANHQDWDIFDTRHSNEIDHINMNREDNRVENLRPVTSSENKFNTTTDKGYYWDSSRMKYAAQIKVKGEHIFLGRFDTDEEARNAYLKGKEKYHIIR